MNAPKAFLLKCLCFLAPAALAAAAAEAYVRAQPNPARWKHEWATRHAPRVETLVLGSSHTYYGLDPARLGPRAFSLALPSQTWRYDLALLGHYRWTRLRTVIVPFSYFSLREDLEDSGREPHTAARYRIYMDLDVHPHLSAYGFECAHPQAFRQKLGRILRGERMVWGPRGEGLDYAPAPDGRPLDNAAARLEACTYAPAPAVEADNLRRLRQMAAWCRRRGVRLVLLTTPVTPAFRRGQDAGQRRAAGRALAALLKAFPETVRLDHETDARFTPADFYDADHLNRRGAEKLSRLVARELADK